MKHILDFILKADKSKKIGDYYRNLLPFTFVIS